MIGGCGGGGEAPSADERGQIADALSTLSKQCVAIAAEQSGAEKAKLEQAVTYLVEQADQAGEKPFRSGDQTFTMPQLLTETADSIESAKCAPDQVKRLRDAAK